MKGLTAGVAIGIFGIGYFIFKKTVGAAEDLPEGSLTPTSQNNLASRGVNAVLKIAADDEHATLGTWIYEKLHPNEAALFGLSDAVKNLPTIQKGQVKQ